MIGLSNEFEEKMDNEQQKQNVETINMETEETKENPLQKSEYVKSVLEEFHEHSKPEEKVVVLEKEEFDETKESIESKEETEEYTQNEEINEEFNNEEMDELNFDDIQGGEEEEEEEKIVEDKEKEVKTTESYTIKSIFIIILQITFVITLSILQYLYSKIEKLWKNTTEKAKKIYEKEQVQKYIKEANETYEKLNMKQKIESFKNTVQEKYDLKKKELFNFLESHVKTKLLKSVEKK